MTKLDSEIFYSFREMISIEKIRNFPFECIQFQNEHHLKENTNKITKNVFMGVFQKIFSRKPFYLDLYELFFKRFKNNKCIFKSEKNKENYTLCDIISTEDIDVYNIEIALIVFHKCDFFQKIKLIFEFTDYDDDGLINDNEIRKMIFTINNLFPRDVSKFKTNSNLICQSLSNIFAKKIYRSIMYYPGNLGQILHKEKCINFETFFKGIIKIEDYQYNFIPLYINIKKCLLEEKKEIEYNMNSNVIKDFVSISYELINQSNLNYNEVEQNIKMKNIFDLKTHSKKKMKETVEYKEKKVKIEKGKRIKKSQPLKLSVLKKSISMKTFEENLIKNKLNKFNQIQNIGKINSPLSSTEVTSFSNLKESKTNDNTLKLKNKNIHSPISNLTIKYPKTPIISSKSFYLGEKKKPSLNLKLIQPLKKDNIEILNLSSSNLNELSESSKNSKDKQFSFNKLIIEKANYDKLVNLQFPPCKIISLRSISCFPKFSYKKIKNSSSGPVINNYLLKTRYEIKDDINKIIGQNYYLDGDNMGETLKNINIKKKEIGKYIVGGDNISPNFFKFKYDLKKSSIKYFK